MKLVKPQHNQPKNVVEFHVSMEMTRMDIKNYLEKIYDVHPVYVNTRIALGKTYMPEKFVVKEDDIKIAYVVLPKDQSFKFPDIVPKDSEDKYKEQVKQTEENFQYRQVERTKRK